MPAVAAQQAAHRGGVLDVANGIKVKVPGSAGRTDTDIARAVRQALSTEGVFATDPSPSYPPMVSLLLAFRSHESS